MASIVDAVRNSPNIRLADWSADADHNRMVVTFLGAPDAVVDAAIAAAAVAFERIDLRTHEGVHPWLGALDVLPFVPISGITLGECAALAVRAAEKIASQFGVPVFLYEAASADFRSLPSIRKEAFSLIPPDFGPFEPHDSAGAVVVGARGPLIAFNANLQTTQLRIARRVAAEVRAAYAGRVRALGLALPSRGLTQVSMNIISPRDVSLSELIAFIDERSEVVDCELIGALPGYTAFETVRSALKLASFKPGQVLLENWSGYHSDD